MIPLQLVLQNFLSYGDEAQTLDFTRFHVACLSGPNGHGKSALLDAITWSLWGQARKGRHDRKPDEGLLRLGARQMRVEFTFELDNGTHRVIRSFRRRPSSNLTELELQILDAQAGAYRPLSEAGATSITQARIDRLLSMDYDTFTNSAFLLQGHANAFTSKGSRERKQLLARVLGLGRYDRLQDGARARQQTRTTELAGLRQQGSALAAELSALPAVERDLTQTQTELAAADSGLLQSESDYHLWRERRLRAQSLQLESQRLSEDAAVLEATDKRLQADTARLLGVRSADDEMLSQAQRVEADAVRHDHLQRELTQCQAQQESTQAIEPACVELQRQIDSARNLVVQRRTTWEARRDSLDERLRRFNEVLLDAERIGTAYARLIDERAELDELRRKRRHWEDLCGTRDKAAHAIDLEQRRIVERQRGNEARLHDIQQRITGAANISRQIEQAENELEAAGKRAEEIRVLREDGMRMRTQLEQARQRLVEVDTEHADLAERIAALGRGDLTECPLCGTDLDTDHRLRIDVELGEHQAMLAARRQQFEQEISTLEERLGDLRQRFRALEQHDVDLANLQEQVALLRARRRQLDEDERAAAAVLVEISDLGGQLQRQDFAPETRTTATEADAALAALAFDPTRLTELDQVVRDGATVDAERQLLQGARQDRDQTADERLQAVSHVQAAADELSTGAFSHVLDTELQRLRSDQAAIGYDAARHEDVRKQLSELVDAPVQTERLKTARQRSKETEAALQRLHDEVASVTQRRDALNAHRRQLADSLTDLADVDAGCAAAQAQVEQRRKERDLLLERRGSLAARQQHLAAQSGQAQALQQRQQVVEKEHWHYTELVEAFGKDGIQALVIESAIPEIEDEANAILRRLTNNRIQVTIESLRDLKGGGSRETLDVKIADELGERPYDLYSGGEAFRTDFALRIALSKVLARRSGTRLRTLIIDEGFGTQDAEGLEQLTEAIHQISRDFDKVLIVTHLDELKDAFPVRIEVSKDPDRGSSFEIVD